MYIYANITHMYVYIYTHTYIHTYIHTQKASCVANRGTWTGGVNTLLPESKWDVQPCSNSKVDGYVFACVCRMSYACVHAYESFERGELLCYTPFTACVHAYESFCMEQSMILSRSAPPQEIGRMHTCIHVCNNWNMFDCAATSKCTIPPSH